MVNGKLQAVVDARFGAARTPTRNGMFKVYRKSKNHVSSLYHSPMPYSMFFSGGQAVHYSSDFKARGYNGASHGCLNIRDKNKLAWIFARVQVGDQGPGLQRLISSTSTTAAGSHRPPRSAFSSAFPNALYSRGSTRQNAASATPVAVPSNVRTAMSAADCAGHP